MRPPDPIRRLARHHPRSIRPQKRSISLLPRLFPQAPPDPHRRAATTSASNTDWLAWLKSASALSTVGGGGGSEGKKALLFAGLGSYPHTPHAPTPSSLQIWEQASEALLEPDATIGYFPKGMEEFAGSVRGGRGIRGWLRGWVEGRSLDVLMARADITAAFILSSSVAILASEQEKSGTASMLPAGTAYLVGHGFVGTLTALVAAGRIDLATGVRIARIAASLPPSPPGKGTRKYLTTVLSARHFHSLSSPSMGVPWEPTGFNEAESSSAPGQRRRTMQLILDEVHTLQKEWEGGGQEWAEASTINSSKVVIVSGTQQAVWQLIERLQQLGLANPVMDVHMPGPYHTKLMEHAVPSFRETLSRCHFVEPSPTELDQVTVLDPMTTHPLGSAASALLPHLTHQLRWHKTLSRLYTPISPAVTSFHTVGRGAKGLGVMLRGELKMRPEGAVVIGVAEFGVRESGPVNSRVRPRA